MFIRMKLFPQIIIIILCVVCILQPIVAHKSNMCDRTCGAVSLKDLPSPFGFSAGCHIRLNCTTAGTMTLHEFPVQSISNTTILINISAKCDRPIGTLWYLFTQNYAPTSRNGILLQNCSKPMGCFIPYKTLQTHFQAGDCGSGNDTISCYTQGTNQSRFIDYGNLTRTGCKSLFSAISTESVDNSSAVSLNVQVVQLEWWLQGNCEECSDDARCIPVESQFGYRCNCSEGFVGDGYRSSFGCRRAGTGIPIQPPSNNNFSGGTGIPILPPSNNNSSSGTGIPILPPSSNKNIVVIVAPTLSATAVAAIIFFLGVYRWRSIKREQREKQILLHGSEATTTFLGLQSDGDMHFFNLKTIQEATNNFSIKNKLGQGGFGPVYKGKLNDGRVVAVKRLSMNSGQGLREFKTEVRLIVKLQHKNLVKLLGCCTQKGEKLLVYEFMPNNSLDTFLFDKAKCRELDWPMRANIIAGIAKGLRYLHEDSRLRIVHRDMKASNVLLDNEMNAKISDFGTARIFRGDQTEDDTNRIVGTYGYMAPEYAMEGVFSTKSDVYSFGVLLLEIISGQKNNGFSHLEHNLQSYAWTMWKEGTTEKLIDENIRETCLVIGDAMRWTNIALLCIQENPNDRPAMSSVVFMLEGQWASLPQPSEPPFSACRFIISDPSSSIGTGVRSNQLPTCDSSTS